jgi:hypothetical protein
MASIRYSYFLAVASLIVCTYKPYWFKAGMYCMLYIMGSDWYSQSLTLSIQQVQVQEEQHMQKK